MDKTNVELILYYIFSNFNIDKFNIDKFDNRIMI